MCRRPAKHTYRALFLALQADAKEYPGGISALAASIGVNPSTLANCINPDHEGQPPSLSTTLELINLCQAKRSIFALAQLVDQVPMDFSIEGKPAAESIKLFMGLMQTVGLFMEKGSAAASDMHFSASERKELEPLLMMLMQSTGELLRSIRGSV